MSRLTPLARRLRTNSTTAEMLLWQNLRSSRLQGAKFRRQFPIGAYIADFACYEHRLVVEIDGGQHAQSERDVKRSADIEALGFRILRFWNNEVLENLDGVLAAIAGALR